MNEDHRAGLEQDDKFAEYREEEDYKKEITYEASTN